MHKQAVQVVAAKTCGTTSDQCLASSQAIARKLGRPGMLNVHCECRLIFCGWVQYKHSLKAQHAFLAKEDGHMSGYIMCRALKLAFLH